MGESDGCKMPSSGLLLEDGGGDELSLGSSGKMDAYGEHFLHWGSGGGNFASGFMVEEKDSDVPKLAECPILGFVVVVIIVGKSLAVGSVLWWLGVGML